MVLFRTQRWEKPLISREAEAMQWVNSGLTGFKTIDHWGSRGHAVAYAGTRRKYVHVGLWRDIPVAQGPDISYCTPSPLCECGGQWFLVGTESVIQQINAPGSLRMFGLGVSERCTSFDAKAGVGINFSGP